MPPAEYGAPRALPTRPATAVAALTESPTLRYFWGGLRIGLGWIFLWAFLDKLLGLGFATPPANAWVAGGSPTVGFLSFGTSGPLAPAYQSIAGNPVVDAVFMVGLLGIGAALMLGAGVRIASWAGALMLVLMFTAAMPPPNNPVLDDHLVYAAVLLMLPLAQAGRVWGLGERWAALPLVKRHPILE